MTCNVFGGTLNLTQPTLRNDHCVIRIFVPYYFWHRVQQLVQLKLALKTPSEHVSTIRTH